MIRAVPSSGSLAKLHPDFEQVVAECYNDVFRFALSLAKSEADAADHTQQTFLKFARKGGQLRERSKVKSWLFTTLRNEFLDKQRRKTRFPVVELKPDSASINPKAAQHTDASIALDALKRIPEIYREPLALYYLEGYTYLEIAHLLHIPIGTVMSRLSRGKTKLRKQLDSIPTQKLTGHG